MTGIPHAKAIVDDEGYGLECPLCHIVCRSPLVYRIGGDMVDEDKITKGASRAYASHYESDHGGQPTKGNST